jgi:hypothetical protein
VEINTKNTKNTKKENNMNAQFLPTDYVSPTSGYTKLTNGVNKIRILSAPVIGWEDWIDNKPVRYRMDEKPTGWHDVKRPGKHFWALLVWNYQCERIQIFHITQGSIRKAIEALSNDTDWRAPYFYDIKIIREGEGLKTKYTINPTPHKAIATDVLQAFQECRCNLDAIFVGQDPFGLWDNYTPGVFTDTTEVSSPESDFTSNIKASDDLGQKCSQDEMDAFIDSCSQKYDQTLLETYIQKRSEHFKVDTRETVFLLMQDSKEFEKEFGNWSNKFVV